MSKVKKDIPITLASGRAVTVHIECDFTIVNAVALWYYICYIPNKKCQQAHIV